MKSFLINILVLLGITNVYAGVSNDFENKVPVVKAAEGGSSDCSGSANCGSCVSEGSTHTGN